MNHLLPDCSVLGDFFAATAFATGAALPPWPSKEGGREEGKERGREGRRKGGRKGGREGGKERRRIEEGNGEFD